MRTSCQHCRAVIETTLGADPPGTHADAAGTDDDPCAPGDWDNVCETCGYQDELPGGPIRLDDLADQPDPSVLLEDTY